jgi:hypothetical protein
VAGDLQDAKHCREVIKKAVDDFGGIDILVNNAAHQATFKDIGDISDEEWEKTFRTNIHSMFCLAKAAVPHMKPGSAIINTASVNSDMPNPTLLVDGDGPEIRLRLPVQGEVEVTRKIRHSEPSSISTRWLSKWDRIFISSSHFTVRRGVRRISGEPLAALRRPQPTGLLMAALRTSEPYFSLRRIRFRQGRGHGPAAAVGAFHQQSVGLDHRSGSQISGLMGRQRSGNADGSCSIRTPCSALPFFGFRVFILLALRDAGGFAQGG